MVTQSRKHLPNLVGGIAWLAHAQPHGAALALAALLALTLCHAASCFVPLYPNAARVPPEYQEGEFELFSCTLEE